MTASPGVRSVANEFEALRQAGIRYTDTRGYALGAPM